MSNIFPANKQAPEKNQVLAIFYFFFLVRTSVNATAPAINVKENDKEYTVEVAAPGMTKEDFNVHVDEEGNLVIAMEKKEEKKDEKECDKKCNCRYLRREFAYSKFQQTLILPEDVDKKGINAAMHHGVLCILLPRIAPDNKPQNTQIIEIQ